MPNSANSRTVIVALYAGFISDGTLIDASDDMHLTSAVQLWMTANREIECRTAEAGGTQVYRMTGTDGLSARAVATLRLSVAGVE